MISQYLKESVEFFGKEDDDDELVIEISNRGVFGSPQLF